MNTKHDHSGLSGMTLRDHGDVLLVSCYELGHQPIGLAQPLALLEDAGYHPTGIDIAVEAFDEARVRQACVVGISVPMHTALRLGTRVATLVREVNPQCHVCFYGLYASLNADYLLERLADSVIGGEYEVPLVALIEALERAAHDMEARECGIAPRLQPLKEEVDQLEGVSLPGRVVAPYLRRPTLTVLPSHPERVQSRPLQVPSRSSLPALDRYAHLEYMGQRRPVGYVEASHGCLHTCRHCPIVPVYEGRFFVVPQVLVNQDIRRQIDAGAAHITFGDPDFLNGPGHSLDIVRRLHAEFPEVTFDFTAKIEHLLKWRDLFSELGRLGCLFVISAVESFSDRVLEVLEKGHTRADILEAIGVVSRAGVTLRASLVAFTPWTSLDDYLEMLEIIEAFELIDAIDPVQLTVRLLIPPGSALLERPETKEILGPLDQAGFQYTWCHPDPRMDDLHQAVARAVEEGAGRGEEPAETFEQIRTLAYRAAGRACPPSMASRRRLKTGARPPRLTEPWFCCAEPTSAQLRPLRPE